MNKQEISNDVEDTIRQATLSSDMHQYLQSKYTWDDSTIANIDWMIHGNALNSLPTRNRKTVTQLIHDWLPVCGHPGQANQQSNKLCPCCRTDTETQGHFMTCNETSDKWNTLINTILLPLETHFSTLTHIIRWALTHCRETNHPFPTNSPEIPQSCLRPQYTALIKAQSEIGWNQLIRGRWATQWVQHIELVQPTLGEKHLTSLTTSIWQATLSVWKDRCELLHKNDVSSNKRIKDHLRPQVMALYAMKPRLDNIDRRVLDDPIGETLKLPNPSLRDWLKRTSNVVKIGIQRANQRLKLGNTSIMQYFQIQPRTPSAQAPAPHLCTPTHQDAQSGTQSHTRKENLRPP
jgi:hypothetical protein